MGLGNSRRCLGSIYHSVWRRQECGCDRIWEVAEQELAEQAEGLSIKAGRSKREGLKVVYFGGARAGDKAYLGRDEKALAKPNHCRQGIPQDAGVPLGYSGDVVRLHI